MIEIPGYRLLRQLGRGGMATVYLAVQESVDREVALKVMSPALLADPNFGERFLREAKIAARLHHRHVVGIHDVGKVGDYHYMAMEYLAGGPVLSKQGPSRSVTFALRVTREIAGAINYAQQKGFIHRDIKPDNILLRDDGSAALTDFGIARANDSATRMTRTGAVVGTPHYMSPEQARGKQLDGRADLYSLGVVLYEMLVGRVPYHAEDSLAVGIMHITQPVPKLPESLAVLQPLVDGLLAKEPYDRFQTGNDAAMAISRYERAIANGELPGLEVDPEQTVRLGQGQETQASPLPATSISPRPVSAEPHSRNRSDPSMGRLEEILAATDDHIMRASRVSNRQVKAKRRISGLWITLVLVLLALGGGGYMLWKHQDWLRAFLPNTEMNTILAQAQKALDAGHLDGNQDDSARELFQRARSLDLDNDVARRGLRAVGEKLLARARDALKRNDPGLARQAVAAARELLGGGSEVEELEKSIAALDASSTETEALLSKAQTAFDADRLLGDDGAVAIYQRVLLSDTGSALARAGIQRSVDKLAAQARAAFEAKDLTTASSRITDIARILPSYPELPELRASLGQQRDAAAAALEKDLARGETQLRAGRISGNADSAQALFESALQRDPNNARAKAGLRRVAQAFVVQARAAIEGSNPGAADRLLKQAETLAADLPDLRAARIELRELRERLAIAAERPVATPADLERMRKLIAEADQAAEAGRFISPPGNSAYDKYRAALAIDGDNKAALDGLNKIPALARAQFDKALSQGSLSRALGMLEVVRQTAPADPSLQPMSERLANAYLDLAERSIGEKQATDAESALQTARKLSPANPRIATVEELLRGLP
ncbi:MAG TPA: protein kinase [Dokdonella sp.]|uniref:serine/threonine-protein kinase n=1 Tax=Dokdonella sp. TaxID=2291710 RepID=UPI002D803BA1|nr:protein kinase [Dokdonella sp.]HET9033909.1 protein kinase [Dokdonella sp.]